MSQEIAKNGNEEYTQIYEEISSLKKEISLIDDLDQKWKFETFSDKIPHIVWDQSYGELLTSLRLDIQNTPSLDEKTLQRVKF